MAKLNPRLATLRRNDHRHDCSAFGLSTTDSVLLSNNTDPVSFGIAPNDSPIFLLRNLKFPERFT